MSQPLVWNVVRSSLSQTEPAQTFTQCLSGLFTASAAAQQRSASDKFNALALSTLLAFGSLGSLASFDARALDLGRLNVLSSIGEPLQAEIEITDVTPEEVGSLRPSLASAEVYKVIGHNYNPDLSSLQFKVQQTPYGRTLLLTLPESASAAQPVAPVLPMTAARVSVVRGDAAGQLAMQSLPVNVSLDQMLLALLRSNPDAFVAGNVNRLKAGAVLTMPSADAATSVPRAEAYQTILPQSRDFNAFRQQLASNARPAQVAASGREAQGEALLLGALNRSPQRLALHLELMEIYIARGDADSFEALAIEALSITSGKGVHWTQICKKGQTIDPTNPLYQSAAANPPPTPPFSKLDFDLGLGTDAPDKAPSRTKS
ncbi:MAG: FimV/HubP family polar landmark protein [Polaromonas sp.]